MLLARDQKLPPSVIKSTKLFIGEQKLLPGMTSTRFGLFMDYTSEPIISHSTKKLPKTSCVMVVIDAVVRINFAKVKVSIAYNLKMYQLLETKSWVFVL